MQQSSSCTVHTDHRHEDLPLISPSWHLNKKHQSRFQAILSVTLTLRIYEAELFNYFLINAIIVFIQADSNGVRESSTRSNWRKRANKKKTSKLRNHLHQHHFGNTSVANTHNIAARVLKLMKMFVFQVIKTYNIYLDLVE